MLDQAVSLIGRRFVIAAMVPTALFAAIILVLFGEADRLSKAVETVAKADFSEIGLGTLAILATTAILAYVLHGVRALLHGLLKGYWPRLCLPLEWPLRLHQTYLFNRLNRDLRTIDAEKTDVIWLKTGLQPRWDPRPLRAAWLDTPLFRPPGWRGMLQICRADLVALRDHDDIERLPRLMAYARGLQFASTRVGLMPKEAQGDVSALVTQLRDLVQRPPATGAADGTPSLVPAVQGALGRIDHDVERRRRRAFTRLVERFPRDPSRLRATSLGNTAMVQQEYPINRYGIALGELWPRLRLVLPERTEKVLEDSEIFLDFCIAVAVLSLTCGLVHAGATSMPWFEAGGVPDHGWWSLLPAGALLGAFIVFYQLAIRAQRTLNGHICAAIDLHRRDLLTALKIEKPSTVAGERMIWSKLSALFTQELDPAGAVWFDDVDEPEDGAVGKVVEQALRGAWPAQATSTPEAIALFADLWDAVGRKDVAKTLRDKAGRTAG